MKKAVSNTRTQVPAEARNKQVKKCIVCRKMRMLSYSITPEGQERTIEIKTCDFCGFKNHSYAREK